jgi:hypothetical protein
MCNQGKTFSPLLKGTNSATVFHDAYLYISLFGRRLLVEGRL